MKAFLRKWIKICNSFSAIFFRRMNYTDAIAYLKEHDIRKDDGTFYEFGEVSSPILCLNFTFQTPPRHHQDEIALWDIFIIKYKRLLKTVFSHQTWLLQVQKNIYTWWDTTSDFTQALETSFWEVRFRFSQVKLFIQMSVFHPHHALSVQFENVKHIKFISYLLWNVCNEPQSVFRGCSMNVLCIGYSWSTWKEDDGSNKRGTFV